MATSHPTAVDALARRMFPILCFFVLAFPAATGGQQEGGDEAGSGRVQATPDRLKFWECTLPGGTYTVALGGIVSVSHHEYVVDGAARVFEMTISTRSSVIARFYYLEPIVTSSPLAAGRQALTRAEEFLEEAAGRTGIDPVWKKVIKNYPVATHAHTVEYRLSQKDDVKKLYQNARDSWRKNQGSKVTIRDGSE